MSTGLSPRTAERRLDRIRSLLSRHASIVGPIVVLVALVAIAGILQPSFLRPTNLRVVVEGTMPILLLALGQTFVILIGGIDLSNAALASLTGLVVALTIPEIGLLAIPLALLLALAAGAAQGAVHHVAQLPSLIVTLIGLSIWTGVALILSDGQTVRPTSGLGWLEWLADRPLGIRTSVLVSVAIVAVASLFLRRTVAGAKIYAVGSNQLVATMAGISILRTRMVTFGISALLGAVAGLILVAELGSGSPTVANVLLLPSLAAVLMGGTLVSGGRGGAWNTLVGASILGLLRVVFNALGIDPSIHQLLFGLIVLGALVVARDRSRA